MLPVPADPPVPPAFASFTFRSLTPQAITSRTSPGAIKLRLGVAILRA
jgi:hypothetical protein